MKSGWESRKNKTTTFNWLSKLALAFGAIFISQHCVSLFRIWPYAIQYANVNADWLQLVEIWIRCWDLLMTKCNKSWLQCNYLLFVSHRCCFFFRPHFNCGNKTGISTWRVGYLVTHKIKTFSDIHSLNVMALPNGYCTFNDINSRLTSAKWLANELNARPQFRWTESTRFREFSSFISFEWQEVIHPWRVWHIWVHVRGVWNSISSSKTAGAMTEATAASIGVGVKKVIYCILTRSHVKSFKMARSVQCTNPTLNKQEKDSLSPHHK